MYRPGCVTTFGDACYVVKGWCPVSGGFGCRQSFPTPLAHQEKRGVCSMLAGSYGLFLVCDAYLSVSTSVYAPFTGSRRGGDVPCSVLTLSPTIALFDCANYTSLSIYLEAFVIRSLCTPCEKYANSKSPTVRVDSELLSLAG